MQIESRDLWTTQARMITTAILSTRWTEPEHVNSFSDPRVTLLHSRRKTIPLPSPHYPTTLSAQLHPLLGLEMRKQWQILSANLQHRPLVSLQAVHLHSVALLLERPVLLASQASVVNRVGTHLDSRLLLVLLASQDSAVNPMLVDLDSPLPRAPSDSPTQTLSRVVLDLVSLRGPAPSDKEALENLHKAALVSQYLGHQVSAVKLNPTLLLVQNPQVAPDRLKLNHHQDLELLLSPQLSASQLLANLQLHRRISNQPLVRLQYHQHSVSRQSHQRLSNQDSAPNSVSRLSQVNSLRLVRILALLEVASSDLLLQLLLSALHQQLEVSAARRMMHHQIRLVSNPLLLSPMKQTWTPLHLDQPPATTHSVNLPMLHPPSLPPPVLPSLPALRPRQITKSH